MFFWEIIPSVLTGIANDTWLSVLLASLCLPIIIYFPRSMVDYLHINQRLAEIKALGVRRPRIRFFCYYYQVTVLRGVIIALLAFWVSKLFH